MPLSFSVYLRDVLSELVSLHLKKLSLLLLRERISYALFLLIATMCYLN